MSKEPTQLNLRAANRWVRANRTWLNVDHDPMVEQLKNLARTMDAELTAAGRVSPAVANNYRQTYTCLMNFKPLAQRQRETLESERGSTLMEPEDWQP